MKMIGKDHHGADAKAARVPLVLALGRGEALEALFAEQHIWQARQGPLRDALKRHTSTGLWALLLLAGRAERGIKGMGERYDPWLALADICLQGLISVPRSRKR